MKKSAEKELDAILWQSSIMDHLEGLKSVSEITDKLQEIVDARVDKYVKEQRDIIINEFADRLTEMQGEYITLELIDELVKEMKGE